MEKYYDIIKRADLFANVKADDIPQLLKCLSSTTKKYEKGEFIYRIGDQPSLLAMLLVGEVHIQTEDYWGNQTIISEVTPGNIFAEAYAVTPEMPIAVNAVAVSDCTILFMSALNILAPCCNICSFHSQLIQNFAKALAGKNLKLTGKLEQLSQRTTRNKLLTYLSAQSQTAGSASFDIPFNRQQLADYLAVDRSAMSNELSKLRDEGLLEFHKNRFKLN
ncbi:MAG: Crp/Fnr family transcriptional regulator [Clostridia bacterium]|nr:Crp/Fnr family transcriptional regulator [Clostridia bacterium]